MTVLHLEGNSITSIINSISFLASKTKISTLSCNYQNNTLTLGNTFREIGKAILTLCDSGNGSNQKRIAFKIVTKSLLVALGAFKGTEYVSITIDETNQKIFFKSENIQNQVSIKLESYSNPERQLNYNCSIELETKILAEHVKNINNFGETVKITVQNQKIILEAWNSEEPGNCRIEISTDYSGNTLELCIPTKELFDITCTTRISTHTTLFLDEKLPISLHHVLKAGKNELTDHYLQLYLSPMNK